MTEFRPVTAGRFRGHVVDRRSAMLLETWRGEVVGRVGIKPTREFSTVLEALNGSWTVHSMPVPRRSNVHMTITDANGAQAATVSPDGRGQQLIQIGDATLTWHGLSLLRLQFNYGIDGLLTARGPWQTWLAISPRKIRRPLKVEVKPALADKPYAALVLLFTSWLTYQGFISPRS